MNLDPIMVCLGSHGCFHGMPEAETQRVRSELEDLIRVEVSRLVEAGLKAHVVGRFQDDAAGLRKAATAQNVSCFEAERMLSAAKSLDANVLTALAPSPGVLRRLWRWLF